MTDVRLVPDGLEVEADSVAPARLPDLVWGAPLVVAGRWRGVPVGAIRVRGRAPDGAVWEARVPATPVTAAALAPTWARARLRDLEDRRASGAGDPAALERRIVETSLRFGVLCRFTAYVAIDPRVATDGSAPHRVIQPVEPAQGWGMLESAAATGPMRAPAPVPTGPPPAPPMSVHPRVALALRPDPAPATFSAAEQAAEEAARLRAASALTGTERRGLLADLGTRLAALAGHLGGEAGAELRELAEAFRACEAEDPPAGAELEALWTRTLEFLDQLAAGAPPPARRRRLRFWRS